MASLGIGPILKQERLRQNFQIDDISRQTRISSRFLEALENEDFSRLPAMVFTRGFVRQYSAALKIDAAPLLAALPKPDIESAPLPVPPPGRPPKWDPRVKSALQTALFLLVASVAGTGAWLRYNHGPYSSFDTFRVARADNPAASPGAPPVEPPSLQSAGTIEVAALRPVAVSAVPRTVEVTVAAHQTSWVQISADGRPAYTGVMAPSDVRTVGAKENVKVVAGNAGGVDISLNGKKLDPIGSAGQVRSVTLTAEGPQPVAQTPPPSPDLL